MKTHFTGLLLFVAAFLFVSDASAKVVGKEVSYTVGGTTYTGYLAHDDSIKGKRPGVLVVHEWWGHNPYARNRADMLARMGYTAFAVDMYGTGKLADHPKDAKGFMTAMFSSGEVDARMDAGIAQLKSHPATDGEQIAAIGYCMGGALVLGAARRGADLKAVASFHGSLATKAPAKPGAVKAKVAVYNGADDPMVKPEHIAAFKKEMSDAGADFTFVNYANTVHSFTNPDATGFGEKFGMPLKYDSGAESDSWRRMQALFNEAFKR